MSKPQPTQEGSRQEAFTQFFTHRGMLRGYLHAMLRDRDLIDDILSDTAIEVARCWETYDPTRPFGPWVRGVARRLALTRLRGQRRIELGLPEDVLESLGVAMDELGDGMSLDRQKQQLKHCLARLSDRNRELVRLRYFEEQRLPAVAERARLSMPALYTAFSRIHAALLRCMEKASRQESA